ncbi:DJ-1/PfpI family protein [Aminobacter sp. AP02]|uniref:DJ-1/PfpI family protein n=1 Tax=Aminobacter sp. AP02 TaxID=2135737 RepID=UPI0032AF6C77
MPDFNVGFVIFPGITQLDFTGPFEVLSRLGTPPSISTPSQFGQSKTHVVAKTMLAVASDRGLGILPTCTFESCPPLDLICVPGGAGVAEALTDVETLSFIRRQGQNAKYITSVCTGAFLLGAVGLLKGRRGNDALGLCRSAGAGRRHLRKGQNRSRRQCLHCRRRHFRNRLRV